MTLKQRVHVIIMDMLHVCDGNVSKAARELGVDRNTVIRHRRKHQRAQQEQTCG